MESLEQKIIDLQNMLAAEQAEHAKLRELTSALAEQHKQATSELQTIKSDIQAAVNVLVVKIGVNADGTVNISDFVQKMLPKITAMAMPFGNKQKAMSELAQEFEPIISIVKKYVNNGESHE